MTMYFKFWCNIKAIEICNPFELQYQYLVKGHLGCKQVVVDTLPYHVVVEMVQPLAVFDFVELVDRDMEVVDPSYTLEALLKNKSR